MQEKIQSYIDTALNRGGLTSNFNYQPILQFKLTNFNTKTDECFKIDSLDLAEDMVISFISTAKKGEIFINDVYDEDKELFLRVNVVIPKPL